MVWLGQSFQTKLQYKQVVTRLLSSRYQDVFALQYKQVVTRLLSSRYQDVFALLVPSCCDKSGTSCYHLVSRLMTVTDLLQVVPTRLIQAVRNKLLRACCHLLVNNLLRTVLQTISELLEQLVASLLASSTLLQDDNNLFQTCQQLGTSSANTSC